MFRIFAGQFFTFFAPLAVKSFNRKGRKDRKEYENRPEHRQ